MLTAGGFIETNKESDKHGQFSIHVKDLNLFGAENVREELSRVKGRVREYSTDPDLDKCVEVLEMLHSACDPTLDACFDANQHSFQVTTDQVCNAVNSDTKLKFEAIGEGFDGFEDDGFDEGESNSCVLFRHNVLSFVLLNRAHLSQLHVSLSATTRVPNFQSSLIVCMPVVTSRSIHTQIPCSRTLTMP